MHIILLNIYNKEDVAVILLLQLNKLRHKLANYPVHHYTTISGRDDIQTWTMWFEILSIVNITLCIEKNTDS